MAYVKTTWVDNSTPAINATNLNKIEDAIEEAHTDIEAAETKLAGIEDGAQVNVQSDWNATSGDAAILNKPSTPTLSVQTASSSFGNDTTISIPDGAIAVMGTCRHYGGSSNGSRMSIQFKNSGGTVIQTVDVGGFNESNGNDGGSGMYGRDGWTVFIPSGTTSIRYYRSSGSNTQSGTVYQYLIYT